MIAAGTLTNALFAWQHRSAAFVYNLAIDTSTYDELARELARTWAFSAIPPSQPPGFIGLLALIYSAAGPQYVALTLLQSLLVALTALAVWRLGRVTVGEAEGLVGGAILTWLPLLRAYAATLQYEVFAMCLSTLAVLALATWTPSRRHSSWHLLGTGALLAVAALTREPLAVLLPIAVLYVAATLRPAWRRTVIAVLTLLAPPLVMVGGWTALQWQATGTVVILSEKSAVNLQIGNNPNANGTYHAQLTPVREPAGWAFVRRAPGRALKLVPAKIAYLWGIERDPWNVPASAAPVLSRALAGAVAYDLLIRSVRGAALAALFVLGIVLVVSHRTSRWRSGLLIMPVLAVTTLHAVYFGAHRFLIPVLPLVCVVAAAPLVRAGRALASAPVRWVLVLVAAVSTWLAAGPPRPVHLALEAERLEGIAADNLRDPLAWEGRVRHAPVEPGARPVALLLYEALPRGAFVVFVRARTAAGTRAGTDIHRVVVRVRGGSTYDVTASAPATGRGDEYAWTRLEGVLRKDSIVSIEVRTAGAAPAWIDRIEARAGYRRLIDLPAAP